MYCPAALSPNPSVEDGLMARTPAELLADLFKAGASTEYDKLKDAADRKDENLASRGLSDSTIRAQVTTQMFVDSYERILDYVVEQLNIPAESIGIRTQDDADDLARRFEAEAEAARARWRLKRDNRLARLGAQWKAGDEYSDKTANLKARASAMLNLRLTANRSPEAKALEETWQRVHLVVESQIKFKAHDIEERAKNNLYALGKRRPPPPEAYDARHLAGQLLKALKDRVEMVFTTYPEVVGRLQVDVKGLHSMIRLHASSLVDEAVTASRTLVAEELEKCGHEVPQDMVDRAVDAVRAAAVAKTELMLVELANPRRAPTPIIEPLKLPETSDVKTESKRPDLELFERIRVAVDGLWARYCGKVDDAKQSRLDHLSDIRGLNDGYHGDRRLGVLSDSAVDKAHEIFVAYQDILNKFEQHELHAGYEPLVRSHVAGMLDNIEADFRNNVETHFRSNGWLFPKHQVEDRVRTVRTTAAGELEVFLQDRRPSIVERIKGSLQPEEMTFERGFPNEKGEVLVRLPNPRPDAFPQKPAPTPSVAAPRDPEPKVKESKGMSKGMEIFLGSVVAVLLVWGIQQYVADRSKEKDRRFEARNALLAELTEPSKKCGRALFTYWTAAQNLDEPAKPKLKSSVVANIDSTITKECAPFEAGNVIMEGRLTAAYDSVVARQFWQFGQAIIDLHARSRGYFANNPPRSTAVRAGLDGSSLREQAAIFNFQKALSSYREK